MASKRPTRVSAYNCGYRSRNPKRALIQRFRSFSTTSIAAANGANHYARVEESSIQRELFISVLGSNATRRDAKQYLASFAPKKPVQSSIISPKVASIAAKAAPVTGLIQETGKESRSDASTVSTLVANAPEPQQSATAQQQLNPPAIERRQLALVCFRSLETLDDSTLDGLAVTLSQLVKLGMQMVIVLDCHLPKDTQQDQLDGNGAFKTIRSTFSRHVQRLCGAIQKHNPEGASIVSDVLQLPDTQQAESSTIEVAVPGLLLNPLQRGLIPVVPSMAYTASGQLRPVRSADVMVALTKQFSEPTPRFSGSVDRVIVIDPIGGIPSKKRGGGSHIFVNLEQDFAGIGRELSDYSLAAQADPSNTVSEEVFSQHWANLHMTRKCLALLPAESSALIVTPHQVANSPDPKSADASNAGNGKTPAPRPRNALIHNLLTNRPLVSPSLPIARLAPAAPAATLVKRGMPLAIIPPADARVTGWGAAPAGGTTGLALDRDARVDFGALVALIEDSFGRKLDVADYLARVQHRVAGVVVAGDYEGAALLTWEMPPGASDASRLVPYLDKFAVRRASQGASSGVADLLFRAMTGSCFPYGVCWRSRQDNPVNRWYFERAAGSWQIPQTMWTMFWTGQGVVADERRWRDYVGVCMSVKPSWADSGKK